LRGSTHNIPSWDPRTRVLKTLFWFVLYCCKHDTSHDLHRPLDGHQRVPPSLWRDYRESNEFLGPGCFCSVFVPRDQAVFTEAAIFISTSGPFSGEYVAQCAKGECGYLGQSCFLLKIEPGAHISARGSAN
jgi:hypothetical protein